MTPLSPGTAERQAYWTVHEYLTRVDDRLRLQEWGPERDRARRVVANALRWLEGKIYDTYARAD